MKGSVVWFNNGKGFGFIREKETGKDYFVHFSSIRCNGYKTLEAEQDVEFDTEIGGPNNKLQAANVVVVD